MVGSSAAQNAGGRALAQVAGGQAQTGPWLLEHSLAARPDGSGNRLMMMPGVLTGNRLFLEREMRSCSRSFGYVAVVVYQVTSGVVQCRGLKACSPEVLRLFASHVYQFR
ncbi:UNVERIFIED_CONTAM: hypothetical protein K2H54_039319 [Gekko kuhli]